MPHLTHLPKAACAALIPFAGVAAAPQIAEAKSCKSWAFIGQGSAALKAKARANARADWTVKVKNHWGFQWSDWGLAKSKWQNCRRGGGGWLCRAHGVPCAAAGGYQQR